jgi:hypothetical protein
MGMGRFVRPAFTRLIRRQASLIASQTSFSNKEEIFDFSYLGIVIGDLFYDWHLRKNYLATVNVESRELAEDFVIFLEHSIFWHEFFSQNKISHLVLSHSVYLEGLVGRVALDFDVKVILATDDRLYQLKHGHLESDCEFLDYSPISAKFGHFDIDKERGLRNLSLLKTGQLLDVEHDLVSGFRGTKYTKFIESNKLIKILIACHCFSDSPHSYGNFLFSDFSDWLHHLSLQSRLHPEYEWYLKPHPAFTEVDHNIIGIFLTQNPNIKLVPLDFSVQELFAQGINVVFTVFGTIALEAALENILVINAGEFFPSCNYPFTIPLKDLDAYERLINDLPSLVQRHNVDIDQVAHFYDVHHFRRTQFWLYSECSQELIAKFGAHPQRKYNPEYFHFLYRIMQDESALQDLNMQVLTFLEGEDYCFTRPVTFQDSRDRLQP